ncbi:MAG: FtsL-like putative cell division protein [Saprospiraceae bacterium]
MAKKTKQGIAKYFELSYWSSDLILKQLPVILFLGFLGMVYIANAHLAERNVRRIQLMTKDIQELRWQYESIRAEIMYSSKHSEIEEQVRPLGLRTLNGQPKRIVVDE